MNEIEKMYFDSFKGFLKTNSNIDIIEVQDKVFSKTTFKIESDDSSQCWEDYKDEYLASDTLFDSLKNNYTNFLKEQKMLFNYSIWFNATPTEYKDSYSKFYFSFSNYYILKSANDMNIRFNGYIPDFIIEIGSYTFAIEIDGHKYHEKTKEQARADKEKDRMYLKNKIIPIRFTGSEVYHDPVKCVKDTLEIVFTYILNAASLFAFGMDSADVLRRGE